MDGGDKVEVVLICDACVFPLGSAPLALGQQTLAFTTELLQQIQYTVKHQVHRGHSHL